MRHVRLVAVFVPATGASLSLIADTHMNFAFFPLDNPGIVSIPLAFLPRLARFGHRPPAQRPGAVRPDHRCGR